MVKKIQMSPEFKKNNNNTECNLRVAINCTFPFQINNTDYIYISVQLYDSLYIVKQNEHTAKIKYGHYSSC